jgi:recombination protein U
MSKLLHQLFDGSGRGEQINLPDIKHVSHSNLGKELEDALNRTHYLYAIQKTAHILQNPKTWVYTNKAKYDYLTSTGAGATVARTGDGKYLQAKKSNVDFSGNVGAMHVAFDAKQTKGKSFPLKNVERHQIEKLLLTEQTGAIAGLIVWMSDISRVFFIRAAMLNDAVIEMLYKQGRSSISLKQMEEEAIEIQTHSDLREVNWLPIIKRLR